MPPPPPPPQPQAQPQPQQSQQQPPQLQPLRWRHATTFAARLQGLLFQLPLGAGEAIRISPCNAVHTFGMRYAIDVVFISPDLHVIKVVQALAPWRMAACRGAAEVIELAAGQANACGLHAGASCPPASPAEGADEHA